MKEVWVWAERRREGLASVSLEALGKGRQLADELGFGLAAVVIDDGTEDLAAELIYHGADRVYVLHDSEPCLYEPNICAGLLSRLVEEHQPEILLLGATTRGREVSCAVAARLSTGTTAHCIELYINDDSRLVQVVPWLEENSLMEMVCLKDPQIATVNPGVFPRPARDVTRVGEVVAVPGEIGEEGLRVRVVEVVEEQAEETPLDAAEVVVSGGWGLNAVGGFEPIRELAQVLGAALGGTRPAVDEGWIPEELMIGQSGKTVSPGLFVSVGASGAMHYTTGFTRAKVVLAIDQNPRAPIFEVADIGIVGDVKDIVPLLVDELRKVQ